MRVIIINGPNLNLLGTRETNIYGNDSFESFFKVLENTNNHLVKLEYYQSNVEGEIINKIHEITFEKGEKYDGIIINAGGYTHTSVAIADAIAGIDIKTIEVHISNIFAREEYRHVSLLAKNCIGSISGFGLKSYELALSYFLKP
ncbi:MAG: type II 3-dehydroquinate dehydratase [Bacteroidia bacterium]